MRRVFRWILEPASPTTAWLLLLGLIFLVEYAIMAGLDRVSTRPGYPSLQVLDAAVLTLVTSPILWWFVVRPLQENLRLRTHHLASLFESIEEERRRVAMELHDGVGQSLTMLVSGLRTASDACPSEELRRRCLDLKQIAREALTELKRINLGLRPSLLDDLGLAPALTRLAEDLGQRHSLEIRVDCHDLGDRRLAEPVETAVFRIAQEALSNIIKHAHASTASLNLTLEGGECHLTIQDDGQGLPRNHSSFRQRLSSPLVQEEPVAFGLIGMRERAQFLGGRFEIASEPGQGTRVTAAFPIGGPIDRPHPDHAG